MARQPKGGINSDALREQTEELRIMHFVGEVQDELAVIETHKAAIKQIKKKAKLFGVDGKDIDFCVKQLEHPDQQVPVDEFRRHGDLLMMMGFMPQFNATLMMDRTPTDERIAAEAKRQGLMGRPREVPGYAKGSKEEQSWLRGYDEGNKRRMNLLADALDESQLDPASAAGKASLIKKAEEAKKNPAAPLGDLPPEMNGQPVKGKASRAQKAGDDGLTNAEREAARIAEIQELQDAADF